MCQNFDTSSIFPALEYFIEFRQLLHRHFYRFITIIHFVTCHMSHVTLVGSHFFIENCVINRNYFSVNNYSL